MLEFDDKLLGQIKDHCVSKFPEEACGLVMLHKGRYRWHPCKNISATPTTDFAIDPVEYASIEDIGEVAAIVHSHPKHCEKAPSQYDVESQSCLGIPWLILDFTECDTGRLVWLDGPQITKPLYGRKYQWCIADCYTFIRDWYKQEMGIEIPDFYRRKNFWEYGEELYLDNFEKAGFVTVDSGQMQRGDVILMNLARDITSHGAIYLGSNRIAHHLPGRLSSKDIYGQEYMSKTTRIVRHKCLEQSSCTET